MLEFILFSIQDHLIQNGTPILNKYKYVFCVVHVLYTFMCFTHPPQAHTGLYAEIQLSVEQFVQGYIEYDATAVCMETHKSVSHRKWNNIYNIVCMYCMSVQIIESRFQ